MKNELISLQGSNLEDLIELEGINSIRDKEGFSVYEYNGIKVPRTTKIIDNVFNRESILQWALSFPNKYLYYEAKERILSIGEKTHTCIEEFLQTGKDPDLSFNRAPRQAPIIRNAYYNFKNWYNNMLSLGTKFEVVGIEVPVINPFYGGCIDCIAKINDAYYILDFKTSRKISYEYIIQVCAYMWTVNNGYSNLPHISGVGIIRVDKEEKKYEDLFLNEFIPEQNKILNEYLRGFGSILSTYYEKINMEYRFNQYKKNYIGFENVTKTIINK